jgi:hypothetical protein
VVDEGRHVVKQYRFEIVRQTYRRYSWRFVVIEKDGRRRVLDRSHRDYRSPKRVERAIRAMKGAEIDPTSLTDRDPFELPATSFRIVGGVVPLMVQTSPGEYEVSSLQLAVPPLAVQPPAVEKPAVEKPAVEKPAVEKPATPKPAAQKPAVEKPATQKPATPKPAAQKPAAQPPAVEKPAAEQLAAQSPRSRAAGRSAGSTAAKPPSGKKAT